VDPVLPNASVLISRDSGTGACENQEQNTADSEYA
jgi:hypothetical protein